MARFWVLSYPVMRSLATTSALADSMPFAHFQEPYRLTTEVKESGGMLLPDVKVPRRTSSVLGRSSRGH